MLLTSIFTFFFFGEIRNLTTFTRLMDYNNGFSLSSLFLGILSFLWIGAQFPQEKFLSYGRILTLDYYFLLMCILFHYNNSLHSYFLYLFFLNNARLEKIFLEKPDWKKIWSEISKGWSGTCFLLLSYGRPEFFSMLRLVSYCCSQHLGFKKRL